MYLWKYSVRMGDIHLGKPKGAWKGMDEAGGREN